MTRCIAFTRPHDGGVSVIHPWPEARLVEALVSGNHVHILKQPVPKYVLNQALRKFEREGKRVSVRWAESEDQFVSRIRAMHVPKEYRRINDPLYGEVVVPVIGFEDRGGVPLGAPKNVMVMNTRDLPSRANRSRWRIHRGRVVDNLELR